MEAPINPRHPILNVAVIQARRDSWIMIQITESKARWDTFKSDGNKFIWRVYLL